jgi:serine/threonine-protein kinase RsbW
MGDDGPDRRLAADGGGRSATARLGARPAHDVSAGGPAADPTARANGPDGDGCGGRIAAVHDAARRAARRRSLRLHLRADPAELRTVRDHVARWAQQNQLPGDVVVDLQLALGEAVANGVEHAYRDGRTGSVEIDLTLRRRARRSAVAVRVVDHGSWRPAPQVNGHRGRGLAMIQRLAEAVDVRPGGTGTTVSFEIPVRP